MCKVKPGGFSCTIFWSSRNLKIFLISELQKGCSVLYEFNKIKYWNNCYTQFQIVLKQQTYMLQCRILKLRIKGKLQRLSVMSFLNISNCSQSVVQNGRWGYFYHVLMTQISHAFYLPKERELNRYCNFFFFFGIVNLYLSKLGLDIKLYKL